MTREKIVELLKTQPFCPFDIHVADGDVLHVKHRDFMWLTPGGRTIYVARGPKEEDGVAIVDLLLVTQLVTGEDVGNGNGKRKRSKKRGD